MRVRSALKFTKPRARCSKQFAFFFVDVLGHCEDDKFVRALAELETHCSFVKILGSYPNSDETVRVGPLDALGAKA